MLFGLIILNEHLAKMDKFSQLVRWLKTNRIIKLQIAFYLYIVRVYRSARKSWLATYLNFSKSSEGADRSRMVLQKPFRILVVFEVVSTYYMIYVILKSIFPLHLWYDALMGLGEPQGHCLFMGRFILITRVDERVGFLFCLFHLSWRLLQNRSSRSLEINLVQFLYQRDEDIELEQEKIEKPRSPGFSSNQLYLRHVMCYQIRWPDRKATYKIRPNRTMEAKRRLECRLTRTTLLCGFVFTTLAIAIIAILLITQLSDGPYTRRYPNCYPELEHSLRIGDTGWWSLTLKHHRIYSLLADIVENAIIWHDSGIAITLVIAFAYLLNYDLIYYWSKIHLQLKRLVVKLHHQQLDHELYEVAGTEQINKTHHLIEVEPSFQKLSPLNLFRGGGLWKLSNHRQNTEVHSDIYQVQSEIYDFFKQLHLADDMMSDIITSTIVIWLISLVVSCYLYGVLDNKIEVRFIQLLGVVALLAENLNLLALSRNIKRSYPLICSIMALDRSEYKGKFRVILDLYSRHSFGPYYSLAHAISYRSSTFLSLVGWTFSVAVMTETLFVRALPAPLLLS